MVLAAAVSSPSATAAAAVASPRPTAVTGQSAVFMPLTGARVQLLTCGVTVPPSLTQPERHFLAPDFIDAWCQEVTTDPFLVPSSRGLLLLCGGVGRLSSRPVATSANRPAGGAFIIRCGLLYRRG